MSVHVWPSPVPVRTRTTRVCVASGVSAKCKTSPISAPRAAVEVQVGDLKSPDRDPGEGVAKSPKTGGHVLGMGPGGFCEGFRRIEPINSSAAAVSQGG